MVSQTKLVINSTDIMDEKDPSALSLNLNHRFLVIGDVILDVNKFGDIPQVANEAPVPIFVETKSDVRLGGAANVVHNLSAFHCEADLLTAIGEEDVVVAQELERRELSTDGLVAIPGYSTLRANRFFCGTQIVFRHDELKNVEITPDIEQRLLSVFQKLFQERKYSAIVLAEYRLNTKLSILTKTVVDHIIREARKKNILTIVDPKRGDYNIFKGATLVKANRADVRHFLGIYPETECEVEQVSKEFVKQLDLKMSIVTLAADGMAFYYQETERFQMIPHAERTRATDATGAGDTVSAVLAICLINGWPLPSICRLANRCAANAASNVGTTIVSVIDVIGNKVVSSVAELANLKRLLPKDCKIITTSGCFDLFHYGHIEFLMKAKECGDILIVALNTDESVRMLKGETRPVCPLSDRLAHLVESRYVDFIVPFSEETPSWILQMLEPDVHVKGADYSEADARRRHPYIREFRSLEAGGGRSTTKLISRIKQI
ncbi:bifunctional protein HldE-like isoform X1 [Mya arenaria]|uniref:bifunctional protein HldE-like isoform X1 n=2 Tax=Mya arenaria TaxID=6604 RepID=UPI0022E903A4|nr:bifunctional protein HldE-like isoform X1 [Mya arenaria]XP_052788356.1 bifunctional protein HldE-like isoform X1 [Mya arenaria]XP_052788360.1 bifunctional protein HldE-like isoform X1 [Mya arenaria]